MFDGLFVHAERTVFVAASRLEVMDILRLASLTYLQPLSLRELAAIAPAAEEISIPAGGRMLLDGPLHQELVLVAAGRGSVRCAGETIAELGPGDAFGPLAAPRAAYPTARITAHTALRLVAFSTHEVRYLRRTAPEALAALVAACGPAPAPVPVPVPVPVAVAVAVAAHAAA